MNAQINSLPAGVGSVEVAFYREHGYLVVRDVLSHDRLESLRGAVSSLIAGATGVASNTALYDLEDSHTPAAPRVRRLKMPHRHHPIFDELIRSETLLALMRPLLGDGIRLQSSKLNLKTAGYGAPVEWHQDWAFYPYTNQDVLALGVMLDPFTQENGAMMVVPGSHKGPIYNHHSDGRFCGGIDVVEEKLDLSRAIPLLAPAGSISLHHARLLHGSAPKPVGGIKKFPALRGCGRRRLALDGIDGAVYRSQRIQ